MNKKQAWVVFLVQIITIICFIFPAISVKQNNSVATFMVNSVAAKQNDHTFAQNFPRDETTILCIELKEFSKENIAVAEEVIEQIVSEPGVVRHHSFLLDTPHSLQFQMQEQLGWKKTSTELIFPFIQRNYYTALVVFEHDNDRQQSAIANIIAKIAFFIREYEQISNIYFAGEPVVSYYLGLSSLEVKSKFFPTLIVFCSVVMLWVFRSPGVLIAWLLAIVNALVVSMGIFGLMGNSLNLITNLIPVLIFVLSTAMHMHILLSLTHFDDYVLGLKEKLIPNFLVALTTSIGFGSLMVSNVKPIYLLGKYTSISIWIIFISCYVTHLGFSKVFALNLYQRKIYGKGFSQDKIFALGKLHGAWLLVPIAVIALGVITVVYNSAESNGLRYFPQQHTLRKNTAHIQRNITGSSGIEILIPKPQGKFIGHNFYRQVAYFEKQLKSFDNIRHIISLNQYLRFANKSTIGFAEYEEEDLTISSTTTLEVMQKQLQENNRYIFTHFVSENYYRIQVLCNAIGSERFHDLKSKINALYNEQKFTQPFIFTGTLDQVIQIQMYLLQSMGESLFFTVLFSLILMTVFLQNIHVIYLAIIPNLFPLGCMACALKVFHFPTTIGTVMVFSIAFGIAVDSTIHLFHSFYRLQQPSFHKKWSHSLAMNISAIWITSFILFGAFLLIGLLSSFLPTTQFGLLLAVGMISAWFGDVSFLPISLRLYTEGFFSKENNDELQ